MKNGSCATASKLLGLLEKALSSEGRTLFEEWSAKGSVAYGADALEVVLLVKRREG